VIGLVETHGRANGGPARWAGNRSHPARRVRTWQSTNDLDAVLPAIASGIVDEIAHTNAPDSRSHNATRTCSRSRRGHQRDLRLQRAALESLKDVVERVTGVVIRETVPDTFLKQADQIREHRPRRRRFARPLQAARSTPRQVLGVDHFFKRNHLLSLRELALREVAERSNAPYRAP